MLARGGGPRREAILRETKLSGAGHRSGLDRRQFLRQGAAGVGLGLLPVGGVGTAWAAEPPRIRRHVRLGRTGLGISDIGFGSSRLKDDEALVHHALDRGITYFDTAAGYTGGRSEETLGRALQGRRDRVTLVSKTKTSPSSTRAELMTALEGSLERLRTDHLDVYFTHAVNDVARLENEEWAEFVSTAKAQGKIRWAGLSGHGGRLAQCLEYALDHDLVDVILVAYNFGQDPTFASRFLDRFDFIALQAELPRLLVRAKQQDVGVVAMKTLMGAKLNDLRPYETGGATFAQAAFRWVLSNPNVDALVVTMKSPEMVDEYVAASGAGAAGAEEVSLLGRYLDRESERQCRYGCGACADACPSGVPISDVLRTRMYAHDYGDLELARHDYALLGGGAAACLSCTATPCQGACPYGIPLEKLVPVTHRELG
jgi:predicted aldo/keto reductase-like oxidoreductase